MKAVPRVGSLIFLHIPKAAGSTLHRIVERQYDKAAIFHISGRDVRGSIEAFQRLSEACRDQIVCLKGHMPYGLHVYMAQPCTYITLLRNPVDRIISHYYFVLRTPGHYLHEEVVSAGMTLEDYVGSGISSELNNGQTKLLAGEVQQNQFVDALEQAKKNLLQSFSVVGLVEMFDESLILMKRRLGWKRVWYKKRKVSLSRPHISEVSRRTIQLIQRANEKDQELYAFAKALLKENIEEEDSKFGIEVKRLHFLNRVYSLLFRSLG
jgi:hypothetical protein